MAVRPSEKNTVAFLLNEAVSVPANGTGVFIDGFYNSLMATDWLDQLAAWIGNNPAAAGAIAFLIAFCDALAVVGILVPAFPLLFAAGTLIGMGDANGPLLVGCAALGAFLGDALSYWIGYRWGPQMRGLWLFRRYPQLLDRSERMFHRHGATSILIARYVGAVRPFVPAIAGMLHLPFHRYALASIIACITWALLFLAPGWLFGKSFDAISAVADKLALVLATLTALIALAWALVIYISRWFANYADDFLTRALAWSHAHPRLGWLTAHLIDPNRPQSPSLLLLFAGLITLFWVSLAGSIALLASGGPLGIDHRVHEAMFALRNPLADNLMAALAQLGDWNVLLPAILAGLGWLVWRKRWQAVLHWASALLFGWLASLALKFAVDMPRPPTAPAGFGFPSVSIVMLTITLGFFAVLIAREWPGRRRIWPYLVSTVLVSMVAFARLYLGAHWLSDVVSGVLFGLSWVLILAIAYRRQVARSFWMRPLAMVFYTSFAIAAFWHAPRNTQSLLDSFLPPPPSLHFSVQSWWQEDWKKLPSTRNSRGDAIRWPLDVQIAGPLVPVQTALEVAGWRVRPQADWMSTLGLLDDDTPAQEQPILPAAFEGRAEALLMVRETESPGVRQVLRIWPAPAQLSDATPFWVGTVQTMHYTPILGVAHLWLPVNDHGEAFARLKQDLSILERQQDALDPEGVRVLRILTTRQ